MALLARRAHGVVDRGELLREGVTRRQITRCLRTGALIREYPGVYRVGHAAPSIEATYMAAVKACGKGAVLCGRAAAHLLGLIKSPPELPEVTAPTERHIAGIRTRRYRRLSHRDRMTFKRIPVTRVPRTVVDIAPELGEDELAVACHEATVRYRTTPKQVEEVLKRRPTSPGAAKVRRVIHGHTPVTLSALEREFRRQLRTAGLRPPNNTNQQAGAHYVDCRWIKQKLTVELDSYRFHNSRYSWQQDRERERAAYARGDDHRRYTYEDVFEDPRRMLAELARLLV